LLPWVEKGLSFIFEAFSTLFYNLELLKESGDIDLF